VKSTCLFLTLHVMAIRNEILRRRIARLTMLAAVEGDRLAPELPSIGAWRAIRMAVLSSRPIQPRPGTCHENLAFAQRKSEGPGSSLARCRCLPILQCLPSEDAERVAGNKMALNVECILYDGVNSQEPLR
jgi:hypothetical protein